MKGWERRDEGVGGGESEEREGMMRQRGERTNSSFSQLCDFYGVVEKMRIKAKGWTKSVTLPHESIICNR